MLGKPGNQPAGLPRLEEAVDGDDRRLGPHLPDPAGLVRAARSRGGRIADQGDVRCTGRGAARPADGGANAPPHPLAGGSGACAAVPGGGPRDAGGQAGCGMQPRPDAVESGCGAHRSRRSGDGTPRDRPGRGILRVRLCRRGCAASGWTAAAAPWVAGPVSDLAALGLAGPSIVAALELAGDGANNASWIALPGWMPPLVLVLSVLAVPLKGMVMAPPVLIGGLVALGLLMIVLALRWGVRNAEADAAGLAVCSSVAGGGAAMGGCRPAAPHGRGQRGRPWHGRGGPCRLAGHPTRAD